ncbi:MAG: hypothetical protein Q4F33_04995 [Mycoplasmatota bacterium]|nr:hypothetical protein [Mycoplasmatota bacterium]
MQEIVLFLLTYLFVFVIYELFIVRRALKNEKKKGKKKDKETKLPMEIKFLVNKYKLDLKKVDYHRLLHVMAVVSSFDISFIVSLSLLTDSFILQMLIILVLVVPVILISYHIVYLVYKKKGLM